MITGNKSQFKANIHLFLLVQGKLTSDLGKELHSLKMQIRLNDASGEYENKFKKIRIFCGLFRNRVAYGGVSSSANLIFKIL